MGGVQPQVFRAWPVIVTKKDPLPDADALDGKPGKMDCPAMGRAGGAIFRRNNPLNQGERAAVPANL
jgi:hypothetical protein